MIDVGRKKEVVMEWMVELEYGLDGSPVLTEEYGPVIWLDIETRKTAAPESWPYRLRWETFMVSVAGAMDPGVFFVDVVAGTEQELVDYLLLNYEGSEVRYSATREFDEMVLRGRFTNARRALSPVAGSWPNLDDEDFEWVNRKKVELPVTWERSEDVASKEVPAAWARGEKGIVAKHCARDAIENVLRDPDVGLSDGLRAKLLQELR